QRRQRSVLCVLCVLLLGSASAFAQARPPARPAVDGRLTLTVLDQTRAVLPGATVVVVGQEGATRGAVIAPVQTSAQGIALITGLPPGRYNIEVEFSGFEKGILRDVRIRSGENRQSMTLQIERQQDSVTVAQD